MDQREEEKEGERRKKKLKKTSREERIKMDAEKKIDSKEEKLKKR